MRARTQGSRTRPGLHAVAREYAGSLTRDVVFDSGNGVQHLIRRDRHQAIVMLTGMHLIVALQLETRTAGHVVADHNVLVAERRGSTIISRAVDCSYRSPYCYRRVHQP